MSVVGDLALRGLERLGATVRTQLRVWRITECFGGQLDLELREMGGKVPPDEVRFEIENLGVETSLTPAVVLTGYLPKPDRDRRRVVLGPLRRFNFDVKDVERRLPSHTPVRLTAVLPTEDVYGAELEGWREEAAVLGAIWFKTYTFTPTGGRPARIRMRSADGVRLGRVRFWWEVLLVRLGFTPYATPQGTPPAP